MRLAVMSDLHLEFERGHGPARPSSAWFELRRQRRAILGHPDVGPLLTPLQGLGVELVIMAGDIDLECHGVDYADQAARFVGAPVVYVMGNHEAYSSRDLDLLLPELRAAAAKTDGRVRFLENEAAVFDLPGGRLHVLGCTLWTNYRLNGNSDVDIAHAMRDAASGLNDHARIFLRGSRFTPEHAKQIHDTSRHWLGQQVTRIREQDGDDANIVIVTHHAPIPDANPPQFRGGPLSPAFASDLRAEIGDWRPLAWIWGHTHHSMTERQDSTMLLASQRGYVCGEPGADEYQPLFTDIGDR